MKRFYLYSCIFEEKKKMKRIIEEIFNENTKNPCKNRGFNYLFTKYETNYLLVAGIF